MAGPAGTGPLDGVRVVELAGIGPGPFAAMLLADLGADVVRVDRPGGGWPRIADAHDLTNRNKRSVRIDLKADDGPDRLLDLVARADILVEGYRPGVAERLGVGPDACLARRPALVYGRMTGWGQDGPLAQRAGHDISYLAVTGALGMTGPADGRPVVAANLLGDYAGGALYLVTGVLAALHHARATGAGQVVDAAVVDGAAHLTTMLHGMLAAGAWQDRRGVNLLDGGAPFYDTYATSDGGYMAVGPLEPRFYAELLTRLGLTPEGAPDSASGPDGAHPGVPAPGDPSTPPDASAATAPGVPDRDDPTEWPRLRALLAERFATRTRAEWTEVFRDSDACVAPVLSLREAPDHPHLAARATFTEHAGAVQPAPAPRFSATPTAVRGAPTTPGADTADVARDWAVPSLAPPAEEPAPPHGATPA